MKVLVVGRSGQIARSLAERATNFPDLELSFAGRPDLDLCREGSASALIATARPDLIINCAAYTAVDRAESEPLEADLLNRRAAGELAEAAAEVGAPIIHWSTDYLFDGIASAPYREGDPTAPVSIYGRTKLEGEEAVRAANPRHLILRTSWVYSPFGRNFVRTMVEAARVRETVRVVDDQIGCPSSALELADAALRIAAREGPWGTYHLAGSGGASWADLADATMERLSALGAPTARVERIASADWPTAARRPKNSHLDTRKFRDTFGFALPDWQQSLPPVIDRIMAQ